MSYGGNVGQKGLTEIRRSSKVARMAERLGSSTGQEEVTSDAGQMEQCNNVRQSQMQDLIRTRHNWSNHQFARENALQAGFDGMAGQIPPRRWRPLDAAEAGLPHGALSVSWPPDG